MINTKRLTEILEKTPSILRICIGFSFIIIGILGALMPIVGLWMVPVGFMILSLDFDWANKANQKSLELLSRLRKKFS